MPVRLAAEMVEPRIPVYTARYYAKSRHLPLNKTFSREGEIARRIVFGYFAGYSVEQLALFFSQAPCVIQDTLNHWKDKELPLRALYSTRETHSRGR
jgi:hypothetical protein